MYWFNFSSCTSVQLGKSLPLIQRFYSYVFMHAQIHQVTLTFELFLFKGI